MDKNQPHQELTLESLVKEIQDLKKIIESVEAQQSYDRTDNEKTHIKLSEIAKEQEAIKQQLSYLRDATADNQAKMRGVVLDILEPIFNELTRVTNEVKKRRRIGEDESRSLFHRIGKIFTKTLKKREVR